MDLQTLISFATAVGLGALLGIERERSKQTETKAELGGIRTYIITSILGFLSTFVGTPFAITTLILLGLLILVAYYDRVNRAFRIGTTSELGMIGIFFVGSLTALGHAYIGVITTLLLIFLYSKKDSIHSLTLNLKNATFSATLTFVLLSAVILPVLPNYAIDPWGVFNPFKLWLLVVFICGIEFVGYILSRFVGHEKSIGISSALGALVSSTAVANALAVKSKHTPEHVRPYVMGFLIATLVMFLRVLLVVCVLNNSLFMKLLPVFGIATITLIVIIASLYVQSKKEHMINNSAIQEKNPLELSSALIFALLFLAVLYLVEASHRFLGDVGIYASSLITGLVDVDSITLSLSQLSSTETIALTTATLGIIIVVISNSISKLGIIYLFGHRSFFKQALAAYAIVLGITCGMIVLLTSLHIG